MGYMGYMGLYGASWAIWGLIVYGYMRVAVAHNSPLSTLPESTKVCLFFSFHVSTIYSFLSIHNHQTSLSPSTLSSIYLPSSLSLSLSLSLSFPCPLWEVRGLCLYPLLCSYYFDCLYSFDQGITDPSRKSRMGSRI